MYLGQHFLENKSAISHIIRALELTEGAHIIEIGPGKGALTFPLLRTAKSKNASITLIEKDTQLLIALSREIKNQVPEITPQYLRGDAVSLLKSVVTELPQNKPYIIVGNIPYSITGALLREISELELKPKRAILMVQKEVAERITSKEPRMNLLSAITALWAESSILMKLKPDDFTPAPKVSSAIIKLTPRKNAVSEELFKTYAAFIKQIFKQPRKTALNNLRAINKDDVARLTALFEKLKIPLNARPQNLSRDVLIKLAENYL